MKIEKEFEAPLSKTIQKEYNKLIEAIEKVPTKLRTKKQIDSTGGKVSVCVLLPIKLDGELYYSVGIKPA